MRVLFVAPGIVGEERLAPFQQADVDLLRSIGHEVRVLSWWRRAFRPLLRGSRWADVVYCWNISDHAFIASLVAKRLVCVVGGYEFACLPEFHYGNMVRWSLRLITRRVWKAADALLYVDPSLMDEATAAFGSPGRARYVPTGYDAGYWTPGDAPRRDIVLTVCHAPTSDVARLKGLDAFLEAADRLPGVEFHHAGATPESLSVGRNVVRHGWMERDEIRDLYRQAKVYCQLSRHEGLPNALCEAMLCGCVPVGTAVNGIPTAIGDTGFLTPRDSRAVEANIRQALESRHLGERARARIASMFPVERRRRELEKILAAL